MAPPPQYNPSCMHTNGRLVHVDIHVHVLHAHTRSLMCVSNAAAYYDTVTDNADNTGKQRIPLFVTKLDAIWIRSGTLNMIGRTTSLHIQT